ncbi:MAG: hypothetical protein K0U98_04860 [Deltaproteobacteria bacterium]|nr:hypothetical protein [Deltaproteobacteria bacterium]
MAITIGLTLVALALPVQAISVNGCHQICTPTCPCSAPCIGPVGWTTCGAAGQACRGLTAGTDDLLFASMTPTHLDSDQAFLLELQTQADTIPTEEGNLPSFEFSAPPEMQPLPTGVLTRVRRSSGRLVVH